jgi:hypothetical protein
MMDPQDVQASLDVFREAYTRQARGYNLLDAETLRGMAAAEQELPQGADKATCITIIMDHSPVGKRMAALMLLLGQLPLDRSHIKYEEDDYMEIRVESVEELSAWVASHDGEHARVFSPWEEPSDNPEHIIGDVTCQDGVLIKFWAASEQLARAIFNAYAR